MKKTIFSIMAALAVFAFVACDNAATIEEEPTTQTQTTTEEETPKDEAEEEKTQEEETEEEDVEDNTEEKPGFNEPLTIEFTEDGNLLIMNPLATLKYSKNGGDLTSVTITNEADKQAEIQVAKNDKFCFYAVTTNYEISQEEDIEYCMMIKSDVSCYVYGNIMSLVSLNEKTGEWNPNATELKEGAFAALFFDNAYMENHPSKPLYLPATSLAKYCYAFMFRSCEKIKNSPELPAMTLAEGCYTNMFNSCYSLTTAPELPANNLEERCYMSMFEDCKSLTKAPVLNATKLAEGCYGYMFEDCTALTAAPDLPATELVSNCYIGMFKKCTELQTSPVLKAKKLEMACYYNLFADCTKLNKITCLATDISGDICLENWVENIAETGTFIKAAEMTDWTTGSNGIPTGWTTQDAE
ncbi:MAG: hypothetical protein K5786_08705 [Treponema sp.]|nr:hypothetical protein [Treponema sp.]